MSEHPLLPVILDIRDPDCSACKMRGELDGSPVCMPATLPVRHDVDVMVVSKLPMRKALRTELETQLKEAGLDLGGVAFTSAVRCLNFDLDPGKNDIKTCKAYLDAEVEELRPRWILALGNEPLQSLTGKSGIMKHRGAVYPHSTGAQVMATISPSMVKRNPGQAQGFAADLRYFASHVSGRSDENETGIPAGHYHVVDSKAKLAHMREVLTTAHGVAFDIESTGNAEHAPGAAVVSVSATCWDASGSLLGVFAVPLAHPQSPWRRRWLEVLRIIGKWLFRPKIRVAHNGKFDCRWLRHFGLDATQSFDTLLAAHVLDENRPKGLKPLARTFLGVEPWAISTRDLMSTPLEEVLEYNALDTFYTWGIYKVLRAQLVEQPRLLRIFQFLMMPASAILTDVERRGIWVDREKLASNLVIARSELQAVEDKLLTFVPENWRDIMPNANKKTEINFNASNWLRWWLFEYLEMPVLKRGKDKEDGSPGDPSVSTDDVLKELAETYEVAALLLERSKWYKYVSAFFEPYSEQITDDDRIHSTFKLHGTVTGRLSSGKDDSEKVTSRAQIRGVNLQQVPRDKSVRGIFGAPPGWSFIEADYSQVELRVAAMLANERNMIHHYNTGQDLHMAMAMKMTGKPKSQITSEERKMAKPVNFGFLYGMSWRKFIQTAYANYGVRFDEEGAQKARNDFFEMWPDLQRWHARQRRLVMKYGRVESPIGRVRHLPDIYSRHNEVKNEAERQAINSPVQSFASDCCVLGMIELHKAMEARGLRARPLGLVHDAVNFECPDEELAEVLPLIKTTMEQLPLKRLFGAEMTVPLVADLKVGRRWGGARELDEAEVFNWRGYPDE